MEEDNLKFKKGLVSVVLPIYGDFDSRRAILSVESIRNQKGIDFEIIVSEQGELPKLKSELPQDVKYIFNEHVPSRELSDFNPGLVRNLAISNSEGEFIYTNDADILFLNENYLAEGISLLRKNPILALHRPPMRRLPIENFEHFWDMANKGGITLAMKSLDLSQPYLATTDGITRELKVVKKEGEYYQKTFTTSMDSFRRYLSDPFLKGKEPTIWTEDLHCGGNLLRKEHFEMVGRYCEDFINWGCEDSDLQWKLMQTTELGFFPYTKEFEVLHLDHERRYFSPEMWKRNESIENDRKIMGIKEVIRRDLRR